MQSYGVFRHLTTIPLFFVLSLYDKWRYSATVFFYPSEFVATKGKCKKLPGLGSLSFECMLLWLFTYFGP